MTLSFANPRYPGSSSRLRPSKRSGGGGVRQRQPKSTGIPEVSGAVAFITGISFHCSCERVFVPRLRTVPVIVPYNNDGCAVARATEAKAPGIRMGEPFFRIRGLFEREGVLVFPSNYALCGKMSARANEVGRGFTQRVEVYSIDESFLDLADVDHRMQVELVRDTRSTVQRWTGRPTCVGIGPTKALAKLANHIAKRHAELDRVCDLGGDAARASWMSRTPLQEVWTIRTGANTSPSRWLGTIAVRSSLKPAQR